VSLLGSRRFPELSNCASEDDLAVAFSNYSEPVEAERGLAPGISNLHLKKAISPRNERGLIADVVRGRLSNGALRTVLLAPKLLNEMRFSQSPRLNCSTRRQRNESG
jgi:hypothetical protein